MGGLTGAPLLVLRQLGSPARPTDIGIRSLQPRARPEREFRKSRLLGPGASLKLPVARRVA